MNRQTNNNKFSSFFKFILAALGSAIGLGNIVRFPYVAYENGGGVFVLAYIILLFLFGIPLVILELSMGHYFKGSTPKIMSAINARYSWFGWVMPYISLGFTMFYPVVLAWCLVYTYYSLGLSWGTDTNTFFYSEFLSKSSGPLDFSGFNLDIFIALVIMWVIVWVIIKKGVKGLEIANNICIPLLVLFFVMLTIWSFTLDGAIQGIKSYLLVSDWSKLLSVKIWSVACGQIFFSLSVAYSILVVYASYLPKKSDLIKAGFMIGIFDSLFALFAGLNIFAILGYMAKSQGVAVSEVVAQGYGLAFVVYPKAINIIANDIGYLSASVLGVVFFLSLFLAGLSSLIAMIESICKPIADYIFYNFNKQKVIGIFLISVFFINSLFTLDLGYSWLIVIDDIIGNYGLMIAGIIECVIMGWYYPINILRDHINNMSDSIKIGDSWIYMIKTYIPMFIFIILVLTIYNDYINFAYSSVYYTHKLFTMISIILTYITMVFLIKDKANYIK